MLYGIYHPDSIIKEHLIFKGGTAIRKIFFPNTWRFSEDLDFTLLPDTDPMLVTSGLKQVCDILENECGIEYEENINVPNSNNAILGFVQFTGPIGMKNKIKIDISRIEKMVNPPVTQTVTVSYNDLSNFSVTGYTLNEVISEKIRSLMQRTKVRDYYDVWKMLGQDNDFDTLLIGNMVQQKCTLNTIDYDPAKIFDSSRLAGLREYWASNLDRLVVDELPNPDDVFNEMKTILSFLPKK